MMRKLNSLLFILLSLIYTGAVFAEVVIASRDGKSIARINLASVQADSTQSFEVYAGIREAEANSGEYLTTFRVSAKGKNRDTGRLDYVSCQVSDHTGKRQTGAKKFEELLSYMGYDTSQYTLVQGDVLDVKYGKQIHDCYSIEARPVVNTQPIVWQNLVRALGINEDGSRLRFTKESVSSVSLETDQTDETIKFFSAELSGGGIFSCKLRADGEFDIFLDKTGFNEPKTGTFYSISKKQDGWCQRSFVSKKGRYLVQL